VLEPGRITEVYQWTRLNKKMVEYGREHRTKESAAVVSVKNHKL